LQASAGASECPGFAVSFLEGLGIATGRMGGISWDLTLISWDLYNIDFMGFDIDDSWRMGQWLQYWVMV